MSGMERLHLQGSVTLRVDYNGDASPDYYVVFNLSPRLGSDFPCTEDIKSVVPVSEDVYRAYYASLFGEDNQNPIHGRRLTVNGSLEIEVSG